MFGLCVPTQLPQPSRQVAQLPRCVVCVMDGSKEIRCTRIKSSEIRCLRMICQLKVTKSLISPSAEWGIKNASDPRRRKYQPLFSISLLASQPHPRQVRQNSSAMMKHILVVLTLLFVGIAMAFHPDDLEDDLDEDTDACLPASCTSFGVSSLLIAQPMQPFRGVLLTYSCSAALVAAPTGA